MFRVYLKGQCPELAVRWFSR